MKRIIVGIDVSKETLDLVLLRDGQIENSHRTGNTVKELKGWLKQVLREHADDQEDWLVCMEHTGIYCQHVIEVCGDLQVDLWVEDAGRIKAFHSLSRGKNDSLDAERIARYGYLKQGEAKLWSAPREVLVRLKSLSQLRKRLLNTKQRLCSPLEEEKYMGDSWSKEHNTHVQPILSQLERQLKDVERKMKELVHADDRLSELYSKMSSVKGIGVIVGVSILVLTNEFKSIDDPRKMACQCGVAPFPYESGKRIRGRTKVSHRAHKSMKVLLNLAARSSVSSGGELRDYYLRKVAEGKNKMVVLNAIRNKLIHQVFACVRDGRKYEENYTPVLV
jgi:transposase